MKRAWAAVSKKSGPGWRITYLGPDGDVLVSLWSLEPLVLARKAQGMLERMAQKGVISCGR